MITPSKLKQALHYNHETGQFTWLLSRSRVKVGDIAGSVDKDGYLAIRFDYKLYKAHRLAWLYIYGEFPAEQLDHVNGIKSDNRLINLRECTNAENNQNKVSHKNSTSRYIGVSWHKNNNKWRAQIRVNDKQKHLGLFTEEEAAYTAYCDAKKRMHTFNPEVRNF